MDIKKYSQLIYKQKIYRHRLMINDLDNYLLMRYYTIESYQKIYLKNRGI